MFGDEKRKTVSFSANSRFTEQSRTGLLRNIEKERQQRKEQQEKAKAGTKISKVAKGFIQRRRNHTLSLSNIHKITQMDIQPNDTQFLLQTMKTAVFFTQISTEKDASVLFPFCEKISQKEKAIWQFMTEDEKESFFFLAYRLGIKLLNTPPNLALAQHFLRFYLSVFFPCDATVPSQGRYASKILFFPNAISLLCGQCEQEEGQKGERSLAQNLMSLLLEIIKNLEIQCHQKISQQSPHLPITQEKWKQFLSSLQSDDCVLPSHGVSPVITPPLRVLTEPATSAEVGARTIIETAIKNSKAERHKRSYSSCMVQSLIHVLLSVLSISRLTEMCSENLLNDFIKIVFSVLSLLYSDKGLSVPCRGLSPGPDCELESGCCSWRDDATSPWRQAASHVLRDSFVGEGQNLTLYLLEYLMLSAKSCVSLTSLPFLLSRSWRHKVKEEEKAKTQCEIQPEKKRRQDEFVSFPFAKERMGDKVKKMTTRTRFFDVPLIFLNNKDGINYNFLMIANLVRLVEKLDQKNKQDKTSRVKNYNSSVELLSLLSLLHKFSLLHFVWEQEEKRMKDARSLWIFQAINSLYSQSFASDYFLTPLLLSPSSPLTTKMLSRSRGPQAVREETRTLKWETGAFWDAKVCCSQVDYINLFLSLLASPANFLKDASKLHTVSINEKIVEILIHDEDEKEKKEREERRKREEKEEREEREEREKRESTVLFSLPSKFHLATQNSTLVVLLYYIVMSSFSIFDGESKLKKKYFFYTLFDGGELTSILWVLCHLLSVQYKSMCVTPFEYSSMTTVLEYLHYHRMHALLYFSSSHTSFAPPIPPSAPLTSSTSSLPSSSPSVSLALDAILSGDEKIFFTEKLLTTCREIFPANLSTVADVEESIKNYFSPFYAVSHLLNNIKQQDEMNPFFSKDEKLRVSRLKFYVQDNYFLMREPFGTFFDAKFLEFYPSRFERLRQERDIELSLEGVETSAENMETVYSLQQILDNKNWISPKNDAELVMDIDNATSRYLATSLPGLERYLMLENWSGLDLDLDENETFYDKHQKKMFNQNEILLFTLPYTFSFEHRKNLFTLLIRSLKSVADRDRRIQEKHYPIRRNFLLRDAMHLFFQPGFNPTQLYQIAFVNDEGEVEPGVDGGGLFKEFVSLLIRDLLSKEALLFDTTSDQTYYPKYCPDKESELQYQLLGIVIGKALIEEIQIDPTFHYTFLSLLLGRENVFQSLEILDKECYKNLMKLLLLSPSDLSSLSLTFHYTIQNKIGQNIEVSLLPSSLSPPTVSSSPLSPPPLQVTHHNKDLYISLVSYLKCNFLLKPAAKAFLHGLSTAIPLSWLQIFSPHELQLIIGGDISPINVPQWKESVVYNGYSPKDSVIVAFWETVEKDFTEEERRMLLFFITSCSRPPLLGFGEMSPRLCISNGGPDLTRLPSASTCMNLLKLPMYKSKATLKTKLKQAIYMAKGFYMS